MMSTQKKLVLIGDGHCGKATLKNVFSMGAFSPSPKCDNPVVSMEVDGQLVDIVIMYSQGAGEDFDRLRPLAYFDADVVLICFSVCCQSSYQRVSKYAGLQFAVPIILVGNKKDLRNDDTTRKELAKSKQEPVKTEEGRAMAEKIGAYAYLECTAKYNEGVREVFETATRAALSKGTQYNRFCEFECCSMTCTIL